MLIQASYVSCSTGSSKKYFEIAWTTLSLCLNFVTLRLSLQKSCQPQASPKCVTSFMDECEAKLVGRFFPFSYFTFIGNHPTSWTDRQEATSSTESKLRILCICLSRWDSSCQMFKWCRKGGLLNACFD